MKKYMAPVAKTVKNINVTILAGTLVNNKLGNGTQLTKKGQPVFDEDEEDEEIW